MLDEAPRAGSPQPNKRLTASITVLSLFLTQSLGSDVSFIVVSHGLSDDRVRASVELLEEILGLLSISGLSLEVLNFTAAKRFVPGPISDQVFKWSSASSGSVADGSCSIRIRSNSRQFKIFLL